MQSRHIAAAGAALAFVVCGAARADDAREKQLEQKVNELERKLEEVSRRVGDGSSFAGDELASRVAELEKLTKKGENGLFGYWKNGPHWDSASGAFKLQVIGRIHSDWSFFDTHDKAIETPPASGASSGGPGKLIGGEEFRRARLGVKGTMYGNVNFVAEYDFAGGTAGFKDVFMEVKDPFRCLGVPANVRVGHFDVPFVLEHLTSDNYITFVERSLPDNLQLDRQTGMMLYGTQLNDMLAWQAMVYRQGDAAGNDTTSGKHGTWNEALRVNGRPYVSEDGSQFIDFGGSFVWRHPNGATRTYAARPEWHIGPNWLTTGAMGVEDETCWGLEAAGMSGPFHGQAELVKVDDSRSDLEAAGGQPFKDVRFTGKSVQAGYFITGERREWDKALGRWDRIKVKKNYGDGEGDGMGALEVALRWSTLDLSDAQNRTTPSKTPFASKLADWTLGLNWYLNNNTRIMLNLIRGRLHSVGKSDAVLVRFQVDW